MVDEDRLKAVMSAVLKVPAAQIGPDSSADTIATWDSLHHMNLVLAVEQEFGVAIPDEEAADVTSYRLLKLVIEEQLGG